MPGRHPKEDGVDEAAQPGPSAAADDSGDTDPDRLFGVPSAGALDSEAGSPYALGYRSGLGETPEPFAPSPSAEALWQEAMATSSMATSTSSWYTDRADTETPASSYAGISETPPEVGTMSDMHEKPPSGPSSPDWSNFTAPKASANVGPATPTWQNRITTAERRPAAAPRRAGRQAHLTLAEIDPWSVLKFSFAASIVAFVILFVAVFVLYLLLAGMGVFDSLQGTMSSVTSSQNTAGTDISGWFSASTILGYTALMGILNVVLIPALSTVGAVIYNVIAERFGGIEVTLRESE